MKMIRIMETATRSPTTSAIFILVCLFSTGTSTLFGYRQDQENSTEPEAFQGYLAAFGLQLADGQGVPGYLVIAQDADPDSASDQHLPSDGCGHIKPPPNITRKYWLEGVGWVTPESSSNEKIQFIRKVRTIQTVNHQSGSKIIQNLYNRVCKSGILSLGGSIQCNENKKVFDNLLNVFALVRRGNCEFEEKVHNVQEAGYLGAIVYDPVHNSVIVMHSERRYNLQIPAMYVGNDTATHLIQNYLYSPNLPLQAQNFVLIVSDDDNIINYLLPFTLIVAVCLVTMMVFSLLRIIRQWRAHRKARLTKRKLKKLPKKKFSKEHDAAEWETCAICIDDYEEGDMLRILPCHHAYHVDCIDPWLTRSRRNCPLCKRSVLSDEESSDNGGGATSVSSLSTTETSETNENDETPLLEDARGGSPESGDFFENEENSREIPENLENISNPRHSRSSNMVTRFLRSVQTMSIRSLSSRRSLSGSLSDDDEEPLIVRTSLRRQGAIRRSSPIESSSSRSSNSSFNSEPNQDNSESEIQNASEDELPITSDDNSSLV
jgi:hypothetical protein